MALQLMTLDWRCDHLGAGGGTRQYAVRSREVGGAVPNMQSEAVRGARGEAGAQGGVWPEGEEDAGAVSVCLLAEVRVVVVVV